MKAPFNPVRPKLCRKSPLPSQRNGRPEAPRRGRHEDTIQLIYAHLPPAVVLAAGQHVQAQTNIEQRAHQLWFSRGCRPGSALGDWIRAESEVVQNLCRALLGRNIPERSK
jgi:hypothetical protein